MKRREFFSITAAGIVLAPQVSVAKRHDLATILKDLEGALQEEMPGISRVEIKCRPDDAKLPLMILAYRD
jgi:hypothetical protein